MPALDFASLPFNSSLMVTSPSAQRQKSWRVLTYLVTQIFTRVNCLRYVGPWVVRDGLERGQKKPTGRGTAHSLVPEHNTLNAGAEENHAAEVWAVLRKLGVYQIVAPIHSPAQRPRDLPSHSLQTSEGPVVYTCSPSRVQGG